mmetsp:Transcript_92926/g.220936  ORF Transcript_92926/g.220936 Transcript_92926/m.220936 type:complete len:223 (+) Transcript_92926:3013-3681(+)
MGSDPAGLATSPRCPSTPSRRAARIPGSLPIASVPSRSAPTPSLLESLPAGFATWQMRLVSSRPLAPVTSVARPPRIPEIPPPEGGRRRRTPPATSSSAPRTAATPRLRRLHAASRASERRSCPARQRQVANFASAEAANPPPAQQCSSGLLLRRWRPRGRRQIWRRRDAPAPAAAVALGRHRTPRPRGPAPHGAAAELAQRARGWRRAAPPAPRPSAAAAP